MTLSLYLPVNTVSCTNIMVHKDSFCGLSYTALKKYQIRKKSISALASQWSGTYVHRHSVHTRGVQRSCVHRCARSQQADNWRNQP